MALTYGMVARGTVVLVEYYNVYGDGNRIARKILTKIPQEPHKKSYTYEEFDFFFLIFFFAHSNYSQIFHYQVDDNLLTFLVLADSQLSWRVAFNFISEISHEFLSICGGSWRYASEGYLNDEFSSVISEKLVFLSHY